MKLKNKIITAITLTGIILSSCKDNNKYLQIYNGYNKDSTIEYNLTQTIQVENANGLGRSKESKLTLLLIPKDAGFSQGYMQAVKKDGTWRQIKLVEVYQGNTIENYANLDSLDELVRYGIKQYKKSKR